MASAGFLSDFDAGSFRVVDVTPPIQQPVTIADAKSFARVEFSNDDSIVAGLIAEATEYAETATARTIACRVRSVYYQGFLTSGGYFNRLIRSIGPNPWWLPTAQGIMQIRQPPVQAIMNIQYVDPSSGTLLEIYSPQIIASTGTPGRVMPTYGAVWPLARPQIDAVIFTICFGYGLTLPLVETYGGPPSQTIVVYGKPTGGTFTLTFNGSTTSALQWNSTATQVQTELQALASVGANNATCSGGPFPTLPIFITWAGTMATVFYQPPIAITPSLTGDPASTAYAVQPPAMPWSLANSIKRIVADSYENREASMESKLVITPAAERGLMPEQWGSYV